MTEPSEMGRFREVVHEDEHGLLADVRNATVRVEGNRVEIYLYQDDLAWVERAVADVNREAGLEVVIAHRGKTP